MSSRIRERIWFVRFCRRLSVLLALLGCVQFVMFCASIRVFVLFNSSRLSFAIDPGHLSVLIHRPVQVVGESRGLQVSMQQASVPGVLWKALVLTPRFKVDQSRLVIRIPLILTLVVTLGMFWLARRFGHFPAGRCLSCGYDVRTTTEPRCPECGQPFSPARFECPRTLEGQLAKRAYRASLAMSRAARAGVRR